MFEFTLTGVLQQLSSNSTIIIRRSVLTSLDVFVSNPNVVDSRMSNRRGKTKDFVPTSSTFNFKDKYENKDWDKDEEEGDDKDNDEGVSRESNRRTKTKEEEGG